ncbi:hypothetical protein HXX76_007945 [Chlamydomonas incerta]|uniref:Uncharacterized protein n=1 Tax=Chlamydomonas incerta TaxID=51695 RepID=A0A835W247_CHLIN|nr:hypothetical protein HXX76_007945 [Chlamydomonas incerta]|eukprot:KAG2434219.1 hypothetical protein HXX76_007945 [Chlamydomonas incerta]
MWAHIPVAVAVIPLLGLLLRVAGWRSHIQANLNQGGVPFPGAAPGAQGMGIAGARAHAGTGDVPTPRGFFTAAGLAALATWLLGGVVVTLLVLSGLWAFSLQSLHFAANAVRKPYPDTLSGMSAGLAQLLTAASGAAATATASTATSTDDLASSMASSSAGGSGGSGGWTPGGGWAPGAKWGPGTCPPNCLDLSAFKRYFGPDVCCCNAIGGVFAAEPHAAAALQALVPALVGLAVLWAALSWLLLAAAAQFAHSESELLTITPATAAAAAAAGEPGNLPPVQALAGWLTRHWLGGSCCGGATARTSSGKPRRVGDVTEPLLAGADAGAAAVPIVAGEVAAPAVGTPVAGSQSSPFLPRCPSETCVWALLDVQFASVISGGLAFAGWLTWVVSAEVARRRTHDAVSVFGVDLKHDPWPLWAHVPASVLLLPLVTLLLRSAGWRARIQQRVSAGGVPFLPNQPPGAGTGDPSPRAYFTTTAGSAAAGWALNALLVAALVTTGVWAAALGGVHAAAKAVQEPWQTTAQTRMHAWAQAGQTLGAAAAAASAATAGAEQGPGAAAVEEGSGWGPDWPGGACPPSCIDLSMFKAYLGDDTCCCNTIGGVFAAEPHAAAALQALVPALVGLAVLWAALSWLLLAAAAQFAHSESELLTITPATAAAAAAAGEPGNLPPVQVVANWLERNVFRKAPAGRGRRGVADPLLGDA